MKRSKLFLRRWERRKAKQELRTWHDEPEHNLKAEQLEAEQQEKFAIESREAFQKWSDDLFIAEIRRQIEEDFDIPEEAFEDIFGEESH
jgi:hypothetical protein